MYRVGRNSDGVPLNRGIEYMWDMKNMQFATNISLYLGNSRRQAQTYKVRLVGNLLGFRLVPVSKTLNDYYAPIYPISLLFRAHCVKLNEDRPILWAAK